MLYKTTHETDVNKSLYHVDALDDSEYILRKPEIPDAYDHIFVDEAVYFTELELYDDAGYIVCAQFSSRLLY